MSKRACSIEGCEGKYYAKGFCAKHYQKNRMKQKEKTSSDAVMETAATLQVPVAMVRVCKIPGCQRKLVAKGLCAAHYQRQRLMASNTAATAASAATAAKESRLATNQEKQKQQRGRFTGIARELDSLGRIVLPIELRRVLDIEVSDGLEIFVDGEMIILKKYSPGCIFCGNVGRDTFFFKGKMVCQECMG